MGKPNKKGKKKIVQKTRKEKRKDDRKEKKQRRLEFYVNRVKPGQFVLNPNKNNENDSKGKMKDVKTNVKKTEVVDVQAKEIKKEKDAQNRLQKEMNRQRKKQLKVANLDEDKNIKQLEKQLKLNKRKNKSIPKSFSSDGLDYLLEVCEPENMKSIAAAEQQFTDLNDVFDDDFALVTGKSVKKSSKNTEDSALESDEEINTDDEEIDAESDFDEESEDGITNFDEEYSDESLHENSDLFNDETEDEPLINKSKKLKKDSKKRIENFSDDEIVENNLNKKRKSEENMKPQKKQKIQEDSEEDDFEEEEEMNMKPEIWEDIYGRTRSKDGVVVTNTDAKYIPPALRATDDANSSMDQKRAEKIARLRKQLKGLLNRLAESNLHNISTQVENMYMSNSRNDMNETLTKLIFEALIAPVTTPERLLLEYVLLVTILHANVGTEVGAHFLQTLIKKFDDLYHENQPVENKELDNSIHALAQLYNFKVFHSQLLYQILAKLSDKFEEKHVECILLVLKNVGFSLRKDDPLALKQLIIDLQKKANTISDDNSRVKYMLDILLAIKNNNVSKIPNYDTTYSEHLKKLQRNFVRKGNYVTQLNISLEDLLRADERGRWWIVGSAWTGTEISKLDKKETDDAPSHNQKLLDLARKQRMNTDTRRNIFCALMSAENFTDAFEKLLSLGLKNQQEREIINVILHCSLQEKQYNPYYTLLTQKFCEYERKYQMTIRCSIWDKLKTLTDCSGKQISILARILTHLFLNQGLPISVLKVIQFSELDQVTLRLIRQVLIGVLLHDDQDSSIGVFDKVAISPKLKIFRESLRLFIHHFLLRNLSKSELSDDSKDLLIVRAKLAEKALTSAENKIKF